MKVVLDTNVVIYGLQSEINPNDDENLRQQKEASRSIFTLAAHQQRTGRKIHEFFIPAPVLCEILADEAFHENRKQISSLLTSTFGILAFAEEEAMVAAEMYNMTQSGDILKKCLRVDYQIIACVLCYRMQAVCSYDKRFRNRARRYIQDARFDLLHSCTPVELLEVLAPAPALASQSDFFDQCVDDFEDSTPLDDLN